MPLLSHAQEKGKARQRFLLVLVLIIAGGFISISAIPKAAEEITLENVALHLNIRKSPAPYISGLIHKATGSKIISDTNRKGIFTILIQKKNGEGLDRIESSEAKESSIVLQKIEGGTQVVMTYSGFKNAALMVNVTCVCLNKAPLTEWSIRIENNTGRRIVSVDFLTLWPVPNIGDPDDDFIVLSYSSGTLIENPNKNWGINQGVSLKYPEDMSAQFITYQDRTAGIYFASLDDKGYLKAFSFEKRNNGFSLRQTFQLPIDVSETWQSPYPIAVGVTQGMWYNSADIYKAWALQQPWCAKSLVQREDVPQWWKEGYDVHVCSVRTYDNKRICNGSYYQKMLHHLRTLQEKIDGRIVIMLQGWENHRRWTAGDYFPIFDSENAKIAITDMRKGGFRPFFYLSGLFNTFENEGIDGSKIPAAEKFLPYFVVDEKTGMPLVYVLDESNPNTGSVWKRHSYKFCVGAPFTKEFFHSVIDQTHELGVDVLQMDQSWGAGDACYSNHHGHTPGFGLYQTQYFQDLLEDMRTYGKSKSSDFILLHEEPKENLIQYLDGFHVREYKEKSWNRRDPGAVGIPLFSYLYHEYAIGYGGDSAWFSSNNDRWLVRNHAINLVTGRTPGGAVGASHQDMFNAYRDQIRMIRSHSQLLKTRAKDFLMLGKMLHPYELDVPKLKYAILTSRPKGPAMESFEAPAVLTSSWQSPDGRVGHLFVNVSEAKQTLKIDMDMRNALSLFSCDADIYSSEDNAFKPLLAGVQLPKEFSRELKPLEVIFIELKKGK